MRWSVLVVCSVFIGGCVAHLPQTDNHVSEPDVTSSRIANLERAARYPWTDDGACAVREASGEWRALVERCYHALDLARIHFQDIDRRCGVASVDAATVGQVVGICMLVQPQLVLGAVIVVGVVIVAAKIAAELEEKWKCKCMCRDTDHLGKMHGPYENGRTRNQYDCEQRCSQRGYAGGGFCR